MIFLVEFNFEERIQPLKGKKKKFDVSLWVNLAFIWILVQYYVIYGGVNSIRLQSLIEAALKAKFAF